MRGRALDHVLEQRPVGVAAHAALARLAGSHGQELVDDLGRMAGLCGDDEIYRALLQQRKAAGEA